MVVRNGEQKFLERMYKKDGNQLVVFYGRKNIGIGALLRDFCKDKKSVYYYARQASEKEQKRMFGIEIEAKFNIKLAENSYDTFFKRIRSGDASKLILIIDEFQRIVKKDPQFIESILRLKSKKLYPGPVFILLVSSSVIWVEQDFGKVIGTHNKKINEVYKVKEIKFVDLVQSFPSYSVSECVQVYGIIGGIPGYMNRWDSGEHIKFNICKHVLSRDGFLYHEAENFIRDELRELSVYNTILAAIASGKRKLNDLFRYTEYSRAKICVYLKNLMEFEVIEKVYSFETGGWENTQKGLYQIKNTYINFWFKYIFPHLSELHTMEAENYYEKYIAHDLEQYLNRYFQKVCTEYLELMSLVNRLPLKICKTGTWIGKQGSIDIIAQNSIRENLIGLCNWSEEQMTVERYHDLADSMKKAKIKAKYYYLFSAKNFDSPLKKLAEEDDRIVLVDMNRL